MRKLTDDEIRAALAELPLWRRAGDAIEREARTGEWKWTVFAFNAIAYLAEAANHHPDVTIGYARLSIRLSTHDAGGVTENDVALAREIDSTLRRFDAGASENRP